MANNVLQTTELLNKLNEILAKNSALLDKAAQSGTNFSNSLKLPSEYVKTLKTQETAQKNIAKTTKEVEKTEKALQRQRIADLKLQKRREQAFDKYDRQLQREQRALNRNAGLYNRIQRGVTYVTRSYNDLAAKKALNGKLTQQEELQLGKLEVKLQKYQGVLKKVDANIGKYQRNVGNYASGWNGLSNSINQLTREAPAFANSVQTGFMALSNNIPILTDEIGRLITANKSLQAEGKPTVSVFRQIMKSLFSLQTLMAVGITLLVVYGKEIGEWTKSLFSASDATSKLAENTEKFREESARISSQTIPQFQALVKISQDVSESEERRADAIKKITDIYPDFNAEILKEKDNTELVNQEVSNYLRLLGSKAKAQAAMQIAQEKYNELILDEEAARKVLTEEGFASEEEFRRLDAERNARNQRTSAEEAIRFSNARRALSGLNEQRKEVDDFLKIYIKNVDLSTKALDKNTKSTKDASDESNKRSEEILSELENTSLLRLEIEKQIKTFQALADMYALGSKENIEYTKRVNDLKIALGELSAIDVSGAMAEIQAQAGSDGAGALDPPDDTESNWQQTFQSITDVARRAFGIIQQLSDAAFEKQFADLEKQKEAAFMFSEEGTAARLEQERQFEAKQKEIQTRQAKAKKAQALFDITIDTAAAVVRALPNVPLSIIIGALGAAQLAMVAAQPIPQFWQGGEVGGNQQIMVNDDPYGRKGSNYKEVIEKPNGQLLTPQGKNVKMTVPKGSFVHPTYDAFINSLDELLSNNIMPVGMPNIMPMVVNKGLSKSDVLEVMNNHASRLERTINNKKSIEIIDDERGRRIYEKSQNKKVQVMNARYKGVGKSV